MSAGTATITATYTDERGAFTKTDNYEVTVSGSPLTSYSGATSYTLDSYTKSVTLWVEYFGSKVESGVSWSIVGTSYSYNDYISIRTTSDGGVVITPERNTPTGTPVTVRATYGEYTLDFKITVRYSSQINVSATVYDTNSGYALNDTPDEGSSSIESQLTQSVRNLFGSSYDYYTIEFERSYVTQGELNISSGRTYYDDDLEDIVFTPKTLSSSVKSDTATFNFSLRVFYSSSRSENYSGTMTFTIKPGQVKTDDIVYIADLGETVYMDVSDFASFWKDVYSKGTLEYVAFTSPSGGTLKNENDRSAGSDYYYYKPTRSQLDLDEVHFEPNSSTSKNATTITISFTAYGTTSSTSTNTASVSGKVNIIYMADSPSDINYSVSTSGSVSFKASDFNAAYKEATGSNAASNMTIVFQNVPKSGTLTYTDSSRKNASAVTLTSSNIKSRSFTNKSSGENQLGDITYTGSSSSKASIEYIAYSGSTPKFKGTVTFNNATTAPTDILVYFQSTNGSAAKFAWSEFTKANSTALSSASKVRFALPSNGALYLSGSSEVAGVDLTTSQVSSVTYRPTTGFNGQDRVIFMAYDSSSKLVGSGTVIITVSGNTTATTTTPTKPSASTGNPFNDVKTTDWFYANLMTLYNKNIIVGKGNGRFDPNGKVTYGEALKMIMESCGYSATVGTGSEWAADYKAKAVSYGWLSDSVSVTSPISRNAVAELVCKVLNITPSGKASPYADAANAYGIELYYTSPQIFVGSTNPKGGLPLFDNDKDLTRAQVCAIICRLDSYIESNGGDGVG